MFLERLQAGQGTMCIQDPLRFLNTVLSDVNKKKGTDYSLTKEKYYALVQEVVQNKHLAQTYEEALEPFIKKLNPGHKFRNYAERAAYPKFLASVDYIYVLTRILRPKVVVETGCATGMTSSFFLAAMEANQEGHLYSIDLPLERGKSDVTGFSWPEGVPVGYLVPQAYRKNWTLKFADSTLELPAFFVERGKGGVDLFFHDSDHSYEHMMFEFAVAQKHMSSGSVIISDDISNNLAFRNFFCRNGARTYTSKRNANIGVTVVR